MKICPKCRAQYEYEMRFCLEDGTPLVISGSTGEATQVLENQPPDEEMPQIRGDQTLRMDENTLVLPNQEKPIVTGEKTLVLPEDSPAPTEQMSFFKTDDTSQITDKMKAVVATNKTEFEPNFETFTDTSFSSSRTGLIMGAVVGAFALLTTAIGALIYFNPFSKTDEIAVVNSNNSASNQISVSSNPNSSNLTPSNVNASNLFGGGNSNSVLSPNANSKPNSTVSPAQSNTNKIATPKPTAEREQSPTINPTPPDTPKPSTPTPTPMSTRTPPNVPKVVSVGVVNGKATNLVKPPYPPAARAVRASGAVAVQVLIDEDGNVISANAVRGHPLLRSAAESAARASKFSPTKVGGQPVKVTGVIVYNFTAQ